MFDMLTVNTSVEICEGCKIEFDVQGSNAVWVTANGDSRPFELYFENETLREFVRLGAAALADMDARFEQEEAERQAQDQTAAGSA